MRAVRTRRGEVIEGPPFVRWLVSDPWAGWVWLMPRLWLGWQWFQAAVPKLRDPAWMESGLAVKAFWQRAVAVPAGGRPPIAFDWYRAFIQLLLDAQAWPWFAKLVAYGELLVGVTLILGAFTAIAALAGAFMNWNFMMAGSAGTNPMLFAVAVLLVAAWRVSGYIGLDYFLLPWLGTPWRGGSAERLTDVASEAR